MTKTNDTAKDAIKKYLDHRAATDELFAASYAKKNKTLDECFSYILSEARKRGTHVCMTDDEVFSLAVHYYDEDDIKISAPPAHKAVHSRPSDAPELTEEEKAAAKAEAIERYKAKCIAEFATNKMKETTIKKKPALAPAAPSLFDNI